MKRSLGRIICLCALLALTGVFCRISADIREYSTYAFYLAPGPEPASLTDMFLIDLHLQCPPGNACINYLRQVDGAKQQWALEHGATNDVPLTWADIAPYIKLEHGQKQLWCPSGGVYRLGTLMQPMTCSVKGHILP
jgi:hypothetical protein